MRQTSPKPSAIVIDLSAAPYVDLQSAHSLAGMAQELRMEGLHVQVVEARSGVRDRFNAEGLSDRLGGISRFTTIADVLDQVPSAN